MNDKSKSVEYFLFHLLQDTTLSLSSLPYLNSLISEFFQHYETSMEADDIFLHGRNIVMCSHAPSKTTFYKFPLERGKMKGEMMMVLPEKARVNCDQVEGLCKLLLESGNSFSH